MKTILLLLLLSSFLFPQVKNYATDWFYPKSNMWGDSITTREASTVLPRIGIETIQVRSTAGLDTLYSNYYGITNKDVNFRVFGNIYTDSVGAAPNTINVSLEYGLFYGTGGFPDITGIEWTLIQTSTAEESFDFVLTDTVTTKIPQSLYFRFRELAAQRNHYNITLMVKKNQ